ncbi:MAG: NERD domain-containing protein, partial [Thermomicrobia bacterium]|nr:NERD domain-containing protein [Thermomicrobia bacterium]
ILFNSGLQGVAKWGRKVRNDQLVDQELRRLSDRYTLIHYPRIGNRTLDHVLVHETGFLVMTTKEVIGRVEVRGTKYRKPGQSAIGRFIGMGGPQIGQPPLENGLDRKALLEALAAEATARNWPTDVPADGLVVFVAPRLVLNADDAAEPPAVKLAELLGWVQSHTRGMPIVLPNEVRQEMADFLIATGGAVSEGHIDPRGPVEAEATPATRRAARTRPTTPQQVIAARTERERLARRRSPDAETAPSGKGRRRNATPEPPVGEARDRSPLVPASGMAKVKRRERQGR